MNTKKRSKIISAIKLLIEKGIISLSGDQASDILFHPEKVSEYYADLLKKETEPAKTSKVKKFSESSWQYQECKTHFTWLEKTGKSEYRAIQKERENDFQSWCDCLDRLNRIDNYSTEQISSLLQYARNDDFWSDQVESLSCLHKKSSRNGFLKIENIKRSFERNKKNGHAANGKSADQRAQEMADRLAKRFGETHA